jgi:hypothetical protein
MAARRVTHAKARTAIHYSFQLDNTHQPVGRVTLSWPRGIARDTDQAEQPVTALLDAVVRARQWERQQ